MLEDPQKPGTLLKWVDQSGNNNNAAPVQPIYIFQIDPAAVNGHPAVRCIGNGAPLIIAKSPTLQWSSGDFAVAMVVKADYYAATDYWEQENNPPKLSIGLDAAHNFAFRANGSKVLVGVDAASFQKFHVVVARGNTLRLTVDGTSAMGSSVGALDFAYDNYICNEGASNLVEVAEVVAAKGVSDSEAASLGAYLKKKFGL